VQRAEGLDRLQHHQGESALPNVCFVAHVCSPIALP
jgi:hypothetical protein